MATLVLETIHYNPNSEIYCYNKLNFQFHAEGTVSASSEPAVNTKQFIYHLIHHSNSRLKCHSMIKKMLGD